MLASVECGHALIEAIEALAQVATESEFVAWTETSLVYLLPHEMMICGIGLIRQRLCRILLLLHRNFPLSYLERYREGESFALTPTMWRVLQAGRPHMFVPDIDMGYSHEQLRIFRQFELRNVAAHGLHDPFTGLTSYFGFSR